MAVVRGGDSGRKGRKSREGDGRKKKEKNRPKEGGSTDLNWNRKVRRKEGTD